MNLLNQLNPQQREAVETIEGPVLILAGAGSGKTRVITYRLAFLIEYCGVSPANVLAVTFTNKAAQEMRDRIGALLSHTFHGASCDRAWVSTFHSFCVRLLREDGPRIGLHRDFSIYDENDQLTVVKNCLRHLGLTEREVRSRAVLSRISHAKNLGRTPEAFFEGAADPIAEKIAVIYDMYNKTLKDASAVDFDDLLLEAVRLLSQDADAALKYNQRFQYILVDEYQDTNRSQYDLVRLLTQTRQNLCVVGDEDQSIYSWRGADIRNIVEFEKDYPNAKLIRLEENYRSTQVILDAATAVVSNNLYRKGKKLWTERKGGDKIFFYEAPDGENEALFAADWISRHRRDHPDDKIAVLYRTNSQSRLYEEAMRRYGLKYNLVGGFSFYERVEVKDLLAYLKAAANPQDTISLLRIINSPPRGIGQTTTKRLEEIALEGNISLRSALDRSLAETAFPPSAI
jgi:DNA helicase-2/ATP-dependent DNA helicase PcrA